MVKLWHNELWHNELWHTVCSQLPSKSINNSLKEKNSMLTLYDFFLWKRTTSRILNLSLHFHKPIVNNVCSICSTYSLFLDHCTIFLLTDLTTVNVVRIFPYVFIPVMFYSLGQEKIKKSSSDFFSNQKWRIFFSRIVFHWMWIKTSWAILQGLYFKNLLIRKINIVLKLFYIYNY